jgi:hypothetical protein
MNRSIRTTFSLFCCFTVAGVALGHSQKYHCKQVPLATETRWGGNEGVEIDLRDKPVREVKGIVSGPGEGSTSTLVQVFLRKPSDGRNQTRYEDARLPVATCETGDDGAFGFSLSPGEYELRFSQNVGVDVTSVFVTVKSGWHLSRKIRAHMYLGT